MNRNQIVLTHSGFARLEIVAAALHALWRGALELQRSWAAARARRELHELSDRTLQDIGLSRGQINSLFR
jgi:uncharacterized protein YjiS (DUF1127 family)